jgi:hypothetical protein
MTLVDTNSVCSDDKDKADYTICIIAEVKMSDDEFTGGIATMRTRKQALGDRNIVGAKIEARRKAINMKQKDLLTQLQIKGIDLNASGLSKLEGQLRFVTDFELKALAEVLGMTVNELLDIEE